MSEHNSIFIKNIYYMLSYAFQNLRKLCDDIVNCEEFDNIQELFSVILYKGINYQLKKGIYKEYVEEKEQLNCIKGKIDFSESIRRVNLINKKLVCQYDDFSENTYLNQILKSTLDLLIRKGDIKQSNKKLLKKVYIYFAQVNLIDIKNISWNCISYHRNNITYKILINLCYLIIKGLLMTEDDGEIRLSKFLDEQYMHKLYEKFILEYYKKHYPALKANASYIDWNLDNIENTAGLEFLPCMQSDIMLQKDDKILIIDAKFYSNTMQKQYDKKSFISGNLYQIFTYVKNKDKNYTGNVSGMLLYAKTDEDIIPDNEYMIDGHKFVIRTLDLNCSFDKISNDLNSIAQEHLLAI